MKAFSVAVASTAPSIEPRLTAGFDLPARWIIHAVGPVWHGGGEGEDEKLAGCYSSALAIAREHAMGSIAFPAISTGIYGFPPQRAARVAIDAVRRTLSVGGSVERVVFCCFDAQTADIYRHSLA